MIHAKFIKKNKVIVAFELQGHAESGDFGHDLVCAAVSALTINTVNSIEKLLKVKLTVFEDQLAGGFLKVEIPVAKVSDSKVQLLIASLQLGLQSIAKEENYRDYITIG